MWLITIKRLKALKQEQKKIPSSAKLKFYENSDLKKNHK